MLIHPPYNVYQDQTTYISTGDSRNLVFENGFFQQKQFLQVSDNPLTHEVMNDFIQFTALWEKKNASHFAIWKNDIPYKLIQDASYNLRQLQINQFSTELTSDESILIKAKSKQHNLFLELFYAEDLPTLVDITLNVYQGKKNIYATAADSLYKVLKRYESIL
jgi:hypothetical protein